MQELNNIVGPIVIFACIHAKQLSRDLYIYSQMSNDKAPNLDAEKIHPNLARLVYIVNRKVKARQLNAKKKFLKPISCSWDESKLHKYLQTKVFACQSPISLTRTLTFAANICRMLICSLVLLDELQEGSEHLLRFTTKHLFRVYPAFFRVDSRFVELFYIIE